ncbi:uncharacterized protein LOC130532639 isoform X1 [Takifugu flavidus]|uniref:uncharacterized protein LOC130532639 isoform X1 n=1 Tax=Takifugu flavidus TaxID=433684 RepID=UPI0025442135|nr:uncharacterized protein LOC130532639 isoform X1 [Takifugu flavidus]
METGAACSCSSAARSDLMGGSVSDIPNIYTAQNRGRNNRQSLSQDPGEHPGVSPCSNQPWCSAEFLKCGPSPTITVRKNKKQPQPPRRSTSLTQPTSKPCPIFKRYSCPPIGIGRSTSRLYSHSSSSSSSSTSSCSSPLPVPTSLITGPDPLGWKLRPKSRSRHVSRLSLQIPLPVIAPDPSARASANSQHTQYSKPTVKPFHRRHSDSSALLTSLATQNPAVTLEALRALHLRPVTVPYETDDVFREVKGSGGKVKQSKQPRKIPPPVPKKTLMARRKAKMIALSQRSAKANEEHIYACVIKPKQLGQTELKEDETHTAGLHRVAHSNWERSTAHFPG